ncbi:MAG: APC family permease [Candidatus Melainabacteria bacterium]
MLMRCKRLLFGAPLPTHLEAHERLNIPLGLAVFASDNLSSAAYATEEILLAMMGTSMAVHATWLAVPVAIGICLLLAVVIISYRQVIRAYPESGGAYVVSRENLGVLPSLIAGAALLLDYILTVAVSISAGVAALTSTGWVAHDQRVTLALFFTLFITYINLRGVRESGKVIAVPAYIFVFAILSLIAAGLWQSATGHVVIPHAAQTIPQKPFTHLSDALSLSVLLILMNAFSHGCAALTGTEAISNGVNAFREPAATNANKTLVIMGALLGVIFLGLTILAANYQITPTETETVVSQIARAVFGGGSPMYWLVQLSTMVILILAANTSFSGFPRLASLLARDGFLPRQLMTLGDKLVFSNGIFLLGMVSAFLILIYGADTHALIPLYAVGVFITFTLAQAGMVIYQKRERPKGWQAGRVINALGTVTTGLVAVLLTYEKFAEGAWIILLAIPVLILAFYKVRAHYQSIGRQLALPETVTIPAMRPHTVLVLVSSLNRGTIPALAYARTIGKTVEGVHVALNPAATGRLQADWPQWAGDDIPLTVLDTPYRALNAVLLDYIDAVRARAGGNQVTVIIPEFVTRAWWHNLLHNQSALVLKSLLRLREGVVVTTVRYHLKE